MNIKPLKSEQDYRHTLDRIDDLMDAEPDSPAGDELDILVMLIEAFEARHHPTDPPDPIEAIKFRMDQAGLTRKNLEPLIGTRGRVSEVLAGKRPLTLAMIRRLHDAFDISADVLIQPYQPNAA
jgi:HTH-type transcriptional regulator / antitoxin HigA